MKSLTPPLPSSSPPLHSPPLPYPILSYPPLPSPSPHSMLLFQSTHYCTLKANAQYESTSKRGRERFALGIRCVFKASVPSLLKMIVVLDFEFQLLSELMKKYFNFIICTIKNSTTLHSNAFCRTNTMSLPDYPACSLHFYPRLTPDAQIMFSSGLPGL